jgi:hypothetical protein
MLPATLQAAYVAEHEEGCLAYELCMSETDPDAFIIYERCVRVSSAAHVVLHPCQYANSCCHRAAWVAQLLS